MPGSYHHVFAGNSGLCCCVLCVPRIPFICWFHTGTLDLNPFHITLYILLVLSTDEQFSKKLCVKMPKGSFVIIIIINPLTARVAGAPQMILQPIFSIFPCSPLPSGTCQTPGLSYKILHISYKDHVTKEEVHAEIQQAIGPHEDLLTLVMRRKLQWYGHVSPSSGLAKTILQGTVKGGRRQGGQRKR